ncbi:MAG: biotin--[acetyl-CoA-carboxylase] ligase [Sedimentisphaerales bacterium]|nr:biotin--[acetyl-CoA-carboxylase] ligase [Sedimentisphaerales bacterium]
MLKSNHIDPELIGANLKTKRIGRKIVVFSCTTSTNDIAAEYAKSKDNDGLVIFADEQTAGRGRAGAKWFSGPAESILCSAVLINCKLTSELLSISCAVAVAEAIGKLDSNYAKIKWPNDIVINGKKIAGILLESRDYDTHRCHIIGIGINCHQKQQSFPPELQTIATSIDTEGNVFCDRVSLAKRLLSSLDCWLAAAEKKSSTVVQRWKRLSSELNRPIRLTFGGAVFNGSCIGIDPEKGLIVQLDTGGIRMFEAAQTTIAK